MKRILPAALTALLLLPIAAASALAGEAPEAGSAAPNESFTHVPAPFGAHRAEATAFSLVGIFAESRRFTIRNQGIVADVEGGASIYLLRNLLLSGGYRLINYELDFIGTRLDARWSGPFVGMTLRF